METAIKIIQKQVNSLMHLKEAAGALFQWSMELASVASSREKSVDSRENSVSSKEKLYDSQGNNNRGS